jgi:hypothetical protein
MDYSVLFVLLVLFATVVIKVFIGNKYVENFDNLLRLYPRYYIDYNYNYNYNWLWNNSTRYLPTYYYYDYNRYYPFLY